MKVNEIPEKIYVDSKAIGDDIGTTVNTERQDYPTCTEYTRTDAFIKKACDAYCKVCGHYAHTTPTHICRHACDYYNDFRKYMKGE